MRKTASWVAVSTEGLEIRFATKVTPMTSDNLPYSYARNRALGEACGGLQAAATATTDTRRNMNSSVTPKPFAAPLIPRSSILR
jgi:hypothetical protein